jgi:hypothetical protein
MTETGSDHLILTKGAEAFNHLPRVPLTRTLADVHAAFGAWLEFPLGEDGQPQYELIDMALATVIANLLPGDPLWLFLVGPPSAGKTEVISALDDIPSIYPLSSLTPQTFASGFERKEMETSLLPRLTGKTITMKDFGTVLTMYREKKAEILAQLREIYDGKFSKDWGNGKSFRWRGKVGLLAGVTSIIDREYSLNQILGERFLLYRIKSANARKVARRALAQKPVDSDRRRLALREIVATFVAGVPLDEPAPLDADMLDALAALAEFTAFARSPVFFDHQGDIELIPSAESPARLAKQFAMLARALSVVRQESTLSLATYHTLVQVAQDTLPVTRRVMVDAVLDPEFPEPRTTTEIAEATAYPTSTTRRYLQELAAHRLVDRLAAGPGRADKWKPSETLADLLRAAMAPLAKSLNLTSKDTKVGVGSV